MKKAFLSLLSTTLVLTAVGVLGGYFWLEGGVARPLGAADAAPVEFTVPRGISARALGPSLVENELIANVAFWRWHLWRRGELQLKAGRFRVHAGMNVAEIADRLSGPPLADDVPFAMIEGWRLRDTDKALAALGWIEPGQYIEAASNTAANNLKRFEAPFTLPTSTLEGYLYPETYMVPKNGFNVEQFIQRQLNTFASRFYQPYQTEIEASGRTLAEVVIMASMLEREEPTPAQRSLVAGILWKRIDAGYALGVDATSRYELEHWNDRKAFLKRLRDPDDPYNTRRKQGLPPGPIGAPTLESLKAALRPTQSEFWYYLHDADKILRPSRNGAEHEALRAKYNVY